MGNKNYNIEQEELLTALGKRVKQLRKEKGIVQSQLAADCNFDATNVSRLEAGNINPTLYTLKKIADSLDVNLDDLVKDLT